jgi:UDP-N-acetyl-D-glucosamine dehydrogenase
MIARMSSKIAEELFSRIGAREARVGVIGLGYVGFPLALAFAERKFKVCGFDIDRAKTDVISRGGSYITYVPADRVASAVKAGWLSATSVFEGLKEQDAIVICVPTPLTPQREPDLSYIISTAREIKTRLRKGQLVVLESTTYPGTTDELLRVILEESGLKCGADFFLAFSPEREDPGNPDFSGGKIPKVVGGVDPVSGDLAQALYDSVVTKTVRVSSARVAEATKLTENIFRAVNIALVNELKMVYDRMGIDVWDVLDAASTKPFGFMRFNPGPGWGGHCIPLDPFYLSWKAREYGISPKFIELAGEINTDMPAWVVDKLATVLNEHGKAIKGSRILILGLAYKKDVSDTRESPSLEIMAVLEKKGARIAYHDPHVPEVPVTRHSPGRAGLRSVELTPENVKAYDAVLVVTDHTNVDYAMVAHNARILVDTRGVYHRLLPSLKGPVIQA